MLNFRLATADIKGAYLESGPIRRTIYVRPPVEWSSTHTDQRNMLWKLTKFPYGIVEAVREWQTTVQARMLRDFWAVESTFLQPVIHTTN